MRGEERKIDTETNLERKEQNSIKKDKIEPLTVAAFSLV